LTVGDPENGHAGARRAKSQPYPALRIFAHVSDRKCPNDHGGICRLDAMYPSPDAVTDALQTVVAALVNDDATTARAHMDVIAFHRQEATLRRASSPQALAEAYDRDRYQCRYCGRKTVLIEVMRLLSELFPEQFPYHRNWKASQTHQAYWLISATHDHVVPFPRVATLSIPATSSRHVGRATPANPDCDSKILVFPYAGRPGEAWPTFIQHYGSTAEVQH